MVSDEYRNELSRFISAQRMTDIHIFDSVDSTNNIAKQMSAQGAPDGTVIIADSQTNGRGRLSRSFVSPAGNGIYLSMIMRPKLLSDSISSITAWTAVAAVRAIESVCGIIPDIKWVNDLLINNRKICGILSELYISPNSSADFAVILGIGINVNTEENDFPTDLQQIASSIFASTGTYVSRPQLAAELIKQLDILRADWPDNSLPYLEKYRNRCITVGKEIVVISPDDHRSAVAEGVNSDFSLSVRYDNGTAASISGGEVSIRGTQSYI